jgi:5-methylcytosine-specific restriction endonuclease McrA
MKRTYIPKLLRMAEEMRLYLGKNQRAMSDAAQLNPEQREILNTLYKALQDVDMKIGLPLFPEYYQPKSRPRPFDPQDEYVPVRDLWELQNGRCYYCDAALLGYYGTTKAQRPKKQHAPDEPRAWQVDHALPRSRGGKNRRANYRLCCVECNKHKGVLTEEEFMAVIALRKAGALSTPGA